MTVQTQDRTYTTAFIVGVTDYTIPFPAIYRNDLSITVNEIEIPVTDYQILSRTDASTLLRFLTEFEDGDVLDFVRMTEPLQLLHFIESDKFPAASVEQTLDKLTMGIQDTIGRGVFTDNHGNINLQGRRIYNSAQATEEDDLASKRDITRLETGINAAADQAVTSAAHAAISEQRAESASLRAATSELGALNSQTISSAAVDTIRGYTQTIEIKGLVASLYDMGRLSSGVIDSIMDFGLISNQPDPTGNYGVKLKLLRGTTAENMSYIGEAGEITVDTSIKNARVHDGVTPGGNLITADLSGISSSVANLNLRISDNEAAIGTLNTRVTSLADEATAKWIILNTLDNSVRSLQTSVSTNTSNIAALQSANTTNISNITANRNNIDLNKLDIGTLKTDNTANKSAITGLQTTVSNSANDISVISAQIGDISTALAAIIG